MSDKQPPARVKYEEAYQEHLGQIDDLALVVLKGHLIIESALDSIIGLAFFNPEHVLDGCFGFVRKVQLARAVALRSDKDQMWDRILAINTLRNEIAHSLTGAKRKAKMDEVRQMFLSDASPEIVKKFKNSEDGAVAMLACAECTGYLGALEDDTKALRAIIDELDAKMNGKRMKPEPMAG